VQNVLLLNRRIVMVLINDKTQYSLKSFDLLLKAFRYVRYDSVLSVHINNFGKTKYKLKTMLPFTNKIDILIYHYKRGKKPGS